MRKYLLLTLITYTALFASLLLRTINKSELSLAPNTTHSGPGSTTIQACRDIFEIRSANPKTESKWVKEAVQILKEAKDSRDFLMEEAYSVLGNEGLNSVREAVALVNGTAGANITVAQHTLLDDLEWQIPYLPCKLKQYKAEDVRLCVQRRFKAGQQTHITYMGDSRIRQQMEALLDILHPFHLNISTPNGTISLDDFLGLKGQSQWTKFKNSLNVTSTDLPGFMIKFSWAPILQNGDQVKPKTAPEVGVPSPTLNIFKSEQNIGAFDQLQRLAAGKDLPDLILLDTGPWQLRTTVDILYNIDVNAISGMKKLYPALKSLGDRTSVVIMSPEPIKEYVYDSKNAQENIFTLQHNSNLEWYLNAQAQLVPPNVQIWDSFLPFAHGALYDCLTILSNNFDQSLLPAYSRFSPGTSFACTDRVHVGYRVIYIAVQQLLNHLCNEFIVEKSEENFCCRNSS